RPIIRDVCKERTPLHASFTPTSPLLTRIRFPSSCVGIPKSVTVSAATRATARIRPWIIGASIGVTHGTATKKNAIGKAKWRSHGFPPADQMYKSARIATEPVWTQQSGRHDGVPFSNDRMEKSK